MEIKIGSKVTYSDTKFIIVKNKSGEKCKGCVFNFIHDNSCTVPDDTTENCHKTNYEYIFVVDNTEKEKEYILSLDLIGKHMLLGRLYSDVINTNCSNLYGITPQQHIEYMITIYNSLIDKPVWCTKQNIIDCIDKLNLMFDLNMSRKI